MMKQVLAALALVTMLSSAALANDHAAPAADAMKAATEKCEVTKDGKTSVTEVAVGECEKAGGKVVAADAMKHEEKK